VFEHGVGNDLGISTGDIVLRLKGQRSRLGLRLGLRIELGLELGLTVIGVGSNFMSAY